MFREQAQAQARHRIKSETTQKAGKAKSLRDQKAKVNVMGMLGVMHQKFGTMGGANAVVHSMFEVVEGFGDISTGDARKAADKAAQVVYIASLNGDEETLQRELAPRVAAYEQYAVDAAAAEEAAAAAAAAASSAAAASTAYCSYAATLGASSLCSVSSSPLRLAMYTTCAALSAAFRASPVEMSPNPSTTSNIEWTTAFAPPIVPNFWCITPSMPITFTFAFWSRRLLALPAFCVVSLLIRWRACACACSRNMLGDLLVVERTEVGEIFCWCQLGKRSATM